MGPESRLGLPGGPGACDRRPGAYGGLVVPAGTGVPVDGLLG